MQGLFKPLVAAFALVLPMAAAAQVYSWTDASGTVHYSQSPPPAGVKYHVVAVHGMDHASGPGSRANAAPSANKNAPPPVPPGQMADTPSNRKKFCSDTQANIKLLSGPTVVTAPDAKGQRKPLSPDQRAAELKRAQAEYQRFCSEK